MIDPSAVARKIVTDVCELPDRTSPEDWPEAMIVTDAELHRIVIERLTEAMTEEQAEETR